MNGVQALRKPKSIHATKNNDASDEEVSSNEKYLCECTDLQSFGKHCEYLLPMGTTFPETIA
jgi:hypothetical protein